MILPGSAFQGHISTFSLHLKTHAEHFVSQIDKEGASPKRAKQEISEAGLLPEEWGGDTPMVEVSILALLLPTINYD